MTAVYTVQFCLARACCRWSAVVIASEEPMASGAEVTASAVVVASNCARQCAFVPAGLAASLVIFVVARESAL